MKSNKLTEEEEKYIKLDYSLEDPADRIALVNKILETIPEDKLTKKYLEEMANYILMLKTKEEKKKQYEIISKNRQTVITERETSIEGLSIKYMNSTNDNTKMQEEDILYNLAINDKNVFLTPRYRKISQEDIDTIPGIKNVIDAIKNLESQLPTAKGHNKFVIKQTIKDLWKDVYVLRASKEKNINCINATKSVPKLELYEHITINEDGSLNVDANISLLNPTHVSLLLCNYPKLKEDSYGKFESDMYYTLLALEDLVTRALEDCPLYYDLLVYKVDGMKNDDIQKALVETFGIQYSVEYISSLWRNKIPKMIAEQAEKEWLEWHYTEEEVGYWKRCSRCGQIKLGHNKFFSKNKTSKDGWYSICKDCRNKKVGKVKEL